MQRDDRSFRKFGGIISSKIEKWSQRHSGGSRGILGRHRHLGEAREVRNEAANEKRRRRTS